METVSATFRRNRLLAQASPDELRLLEPHLEPVTLPLRLDLETLDTRIEHAYFMNDGIASVAVVQRNKTRIEVGLVGCEGMTGTAIVLGDDLSQFATYMQVTGHGLRIAADALRSAMKASSSLSAMLLKYVHVFHV